MTLRALFCRHRWTFIRNIYGDEIILRGGRRSLWGCHKCDTEQFRNYLGVEDA